MKKLEDYTGPDYDDYYEDDDELFGRPHYGKQDKSGNSSKDEYQGEDDDYEYEDDSDDMSHLLYLLRQIFRNAGIEDFEISNSKLDINIDVYMNTKEKLKDIIKVFEVTRRLQKDILPQYDSSFDLYYTKSGQPLLSFIFAYGDGLDDDKAPF